MISHKLDWLDYQSHHHITSMGRDLSISYEIWDIKYCNAGAPGQSWWEFDWLVRSHIDSHTKTRTRTIFPHPLPPPPTSSLLPAASCRVTVVNFSIGEEATSSQLVADWVWLVWCRGRAGCIESNCFAFHWGVVVWLLSVWDLSIAHIVGHQRGERREERGEGRPWTWLDWLAGSVAWLTDMQPRQTPPQLGSVKGRRALSELHSV